jgi:hypothetical protein
MKCINLIPSQNEEWSLNVYNNSTVTTINLNIGTVLTDGRNALQDEIIVLIQYEKRDNPVPSTSQKD